MCESGDHRLTSLCIIVFLLVFSWRNITQRFHQSPVVEPVDPFEGVVLDLVIAFPWPLLLDELSFLKANDGFSQRVVVGASNAAHRGHQAFLSQSLCVTY